MLKIWGRRNSTNVQKVMWTVGELGLAHERVDAGGNFGVVSEAAYGKLNPNRLVPTIEDDGVVLWESNVIVRYLAAKHAPGRLIPNDIVARAKAEMWMDWQQSALAPGMGPLFVGLIRTPPEKRDLAAIKARGERVEKAMAILDAHLAGKTYVNGDSFTVADIPVGCGVYRWYALPIEHPKLPHLRAWYERLAKRRPFAEHVMLPLS
jgi:glutathione S-transferase